MGDVRKLDCNSNWRIIMCVYVTIRLRTFLPQTQNQPLMAWRFEGYQQSYFRQYSYIPKYTWGSPMNFYMKNSGYLWMCKWRHSDLLDRTWLTENIKKFSETILQTNKQTFTLKIVIDYVQKFLQQLHIL